MNPANVTRYFANAGEQWEALLKSTAREGNDPCAEHEDLWAAAFAHRFGEGGEGRDWEVVRIGRAITAFMITASESIMSDDFVGFLRELLAATLPDKAVYLGVYAGVPGESALVGVYAIFADELWTARELTF
jgi:hypothetical protein